MKSKMEVTTILMDRMKKLNELNKSLTNADNHTLVTIYANMTILYTEINLLANILNFNLQELK